MTPHMPFVKAGFALCRMYSFHDAEYLNYYYLAANHKVESGLNSFYKQWWFISVVTQGYIDNYLFISEYLYLGVQK